MNEKMRETKDIRECNNFHLNAYCYCYYNIQSNVYVIKLESFDVKCDFKAFHINLHYHFLHFFLLLLFGFANCRHIYKV